MATLNDIKKAILIAKKMVAKIIILKCTSIYPAKSNTLNLQGINTLKNNFKVPIGYSDHFLGDLACISSINYETSIIEKHFTTSRKIKRGR